ncbi:MAG: glycerate kinase [Nitrospirota bacterium]
MYIIKSGKKVDDMNQAINRESAYEIFYASLKAVDPFGSVKSYADRIHSVYRGGNFSRLIVIALGKAACPMAEAIEDSLGEIIDSGILITKYGHCNSSITPLEKRGKRGFSKIKIFEAGHPFPDENGVKGTDEIINLLKETDEHTLVVCLISGGGSALLVSPYEGITLNEKQAITQLLLNAGADITELNTIRKHLSKVKGGRLTEITYPSKIISLILSDVIGDKLDVIASGPTSPDTTTYADALKVLEKYGLIEKTPKIIIEVLRKGAKSLIPETPKEGDKIFNNVENIIIGSNRIALDAAKKKAEELGFNTEIISSDLAGEARYVGKWLAEEVRKCGSAEVQKNKKPLCLISGGETTVTVKGNGLGGRNMELALAFAMEIEGIDGVTLLSAGTDGTDGRTDAAGAIVNGETVKKAKAAGLDPVKYLANNDSYNFFKKIDDLFITGPTGTNVMDIQIVIIE